MLSSVLVALMFSTVGFVAGRRQHMRHMENLSSEQSNLILDASDVNEAAELNTKAFADVRAATGACYGKAVPPPCCCVAAASEKNCEAFDNGQGGFFFYPGVRPNGPLALQTRTCSAKGWCCKTSSNGKCPTLSSLHVRVKQGENLENKSKVYAKVKVGMSEWRRTAPWIGKGACQWNQEFPFSFRPDSVVVALKYKSGFFTKKYGVYNVPPISFKFWDAAPQEVTLQIPKFGKLTLEVSSLPWSGGSKLPAHDDDFDTGLCHAVSNSLVQGSISDQKQPTHNPFEDFLSELDAQAPLETKLIKDTPAFLNVLAHKPNQQLADTGKFLTRDYTLIIDRSGSMGIEDWLHVPAKTAKMLGKSEGTYSLSRWQQVNGALQYLVPYITAEDPDGIGVYFFDSKWDEAPNLCDDKQVISLFNKNRPGGGTYLAGVLNEAMEPDTVGRAETIFVITDGAASDKDAVTRAIISYTHKMCKPEMLSISFIQVGTDESAQTFLNKLDDDLEKQGAKFDIVDAMTKDEMEGKSFLDVVELSVYD